MADYVTLMGAEQVAGAARMMASAADDMNRAAGNVDSALERHQRFLDDWLMRLADVMQPPQSPDGALREMCRPSVLFRPELRRLEGGPLPGHAWAAVYHGVVLGQGATPDDAVRDFDQRWTRT